MLSAASDADNASERGDRHRTQSEEPAAARAIANLAIGVVAPRPDGAVAFQDVVGNVARSNGDHIGETRHLHRNQAPRVLTIADLMRRSPRPDGAIRFQCHRACRARGNSNDVDEPTHSNGSRLCDLIVETELSFRVRAPGEQRAVGFERQRMRAPRRDGDDTRRAGYRAGNTAVQRLSALLRAASPRPHLP